MPILFSQVFCVKFMVFIQPKEEKAIHIMSHHTSLRIRPIESRQTALRCVLGEGGGKGGDAVKQKRD